MISTIPIVTPDEQTYFDLCPPGASRDPQYGHPSTASDAPMTPIPVADESMPDAVAGEPLRHSLLYLLCLRKMCLQPHHHGLHLCQSSMRRPRPNHLSLLTLIHNPKLHFQHPQLMMNPCHFPMMMIHHHGSIKNPKHSGFLPSKIHQRSFHSKCRHHPCRFLGHGSRNMSTGDPIIPPPP